MWNPLCCKDLMKQMIVAVQCLLPVEVGSDDTAGRIIYGDMQLGLAVTEPVVQGSIHLYDFSEICGSRTTGMGLFGSDDLCFYLVLFFGDSSFLLCP